MKFGIIVFPGSNCDADCFNVVHAVFGCSAEYVWHKETNLKKFDVLIIPGGFSYGDYLRCGAIAKFSPVMDEVKKFADKGGAVLGICNGFQILIEAGLLPGALIKNQGLKFICDTVHLKLNNNRLPFTKQGKLNSTYQMPIAHMEGNYFIEDEGFKSLEANNQIVFQYADHLGNVGAASNPNGARASIAGICNKAGNVLGMMPHPERVCESILGGEDGRLIFESLLT